MPLTKLKLNSEFKAKWVAALRSGEYEQAEGALKDYEEGFCCMGVACDLLAKEGQGEWSGDSFRFEGHHNNLVLPDTVGALLFGTSLSTVDMTPELTNPKVMLGGKEYQLSDLNDGVANLGAHAPSEEEDEDELPPSYSLEPLTFAQIADIIEEQL